MTDNPDQHRFANDQVSVAVLAQGAELCSLQFGGQELLWQAGPEWPRHAPVLFPIVGELKDNRMRDGGRSYTMGRHGLARDCRFTWQARDADGCTLILHDGPGTRAHFPHAFALTLDYRLDGPSLVVTTTVANPGEQVLPASVGQHPALAWPLPGATDKAAHQITFAEPEPAPIRRLRANLLQPDPFPTPVQGRVLALDESLFQADAIIMDQVRSRSLRYTAPGAVAIDVSWDGYEQLGIWSKLGATLLCIEPWHGFASPAEFDGEFADKPGLMLIPPGGERRLTHTLRVSQP